MKRRERPNGIQRAYSMIDIKAIDSEPDHWTIKGTATTPKPDRLNDIVDPLGAEFAMDLPLLWQHTASKPIGRAQFAAPTKNGIKFTAQIPKVIEPGALKDRIDEAIQSLKYRLVGAVSIGFRILDDALEFLDNGGIKFLRTEIMELSLVTIPANMDATISTVKSLDADARAKSGRFASRVLRDITSTPAGVTATPTKRIAHKEGNQMKSVQEQITAFEAKRAAAHARMEEIMSKSADEERTLDDTEQTEYDELSGDVESIDKHLVRLRSLQKAQAATARPATGGDTDAGSRARSPIITLNQKPAVPGLNFARYVKCLAASHGNRMEALEIAKFRYPDLQDLHTVLKSAVAAGTTTDADWAASLFEYNTLASEFIDFLRPQTILGKFGVGGIPSLHTIPFNVRIQSQTTGGAGYWTGQGKGKGLTRFNFTAVNLGQYKVANIAVLTEELVRFSNPSADLLVRKALAAALIERLDTDFVDPGKSLSAGVSPASITNGVSPITSSGSDANGLRADMAAAMLQLSSANISLLSAVWITNSANALNIGLMRNALGQPEFPGMAITGGTLMGLPVIVSDYVPNDTSGGLLILVAADEVFLADDGVVTIDASREASLEMEETPSQASDVPTPSSTNMVSMWQTNSVALRAERHINWQKRRADAVAYVSGANYQASTNT